MRQNAADYPGAGINLLQEPGREMELQMSRGTAPGAGLISPSGARERRLTRAEMAIGRGARRGGAGDCPRVTRGRFTGHGRVW